jgi:hypothetical protein
MPAGGHLISPGILSELVENICPVVAKNSDNKIIG